MTITAETFQPRSLRENPSGQAAASILAASLNAVDPVSLVRRTVSREGASLQVGEKGIDLNVQGRVTLLGIGKAALPMTVAMADLLEDHFREGILLTKPGCQALPERFQGQMKLYTGGHPVPDKSGFEAARAILGRISSLSPDDLVIILLSGGGSALFTLPAPGLDLEDLILTNQLLLTCGADINEINAVRKHLSSVKGGLLARAINPARSITLILSDVIGNRLDSIASGPTVPDRTTYREALAVIRKYHLSPPERVREHLHQGARGEIPETPKPGDPLFQDHSTLLIGSNRDACQAAQRQAAQEGFHSAILANPLAGEARAAGQEMGIQLRDLVEAGSPLERPACLIAGGETTVTLTDTRNPGVGGRNLELALSAVDPVAGLKNCALITLATDGVDGVSKAAGAIVTGNSLLRASQAGLSPDEFLRDHNAYPFFSALDDLLITGPTGTNVNDLCFLFHFP